MKPFTRIFEFSIDYFKNDHLTLKMTSAQVVETSVANNSPQDSNHPDDNFQSRRGSLSPSKTKMEWTLQLVSGTKLAYGVCTLIVSLLAVSLIHLPARFRPSIILVCIYRPTRISTAPRMICQQHSGGLKVICERSTTLTTEFQLMAQ